MSNIVTNLKVRFGADSSNFKKGMNEGKQAMGDLKSEGKSAFEGLAGIFGVNVGAINKGASVFSTSMKAMGGSMKGAAAGSGVLSGALKILKIALISTGIGAILVALGSLVAYFTRTKDGSDKLSQAADYLSAAFSVVVDRLSAITVAMGKAFSDPKKMIGDLWEFLKSQLLNRIAAIPKMLQAAWNVVKGIFDKDINSKDAAKDFGRAYMQVLTGFDTSQQKKIIDSIKGVGAEIVNEGDAAVNLKKQLQQLEDQEIALIETQAKRRKEIAAARLMSRDEEISAEQRLVAIKRAVALENETLQEQLQIARERARVIEEQKALGNNLREDDRELAEAKAKVADLEEQSLTRQRRMVSEINTLTREIQGQTEALHKQRIELEKTMNPQGSIEGAKMGSGFKTDQKKELDNIAAAQERVIANQGFMADMGIVLPDLAPAISIWEEYGESVKGVMIDLSEVLEGALEDITVGFASTFGQLMAGTGDLGQFSSMVLGTLGDLAIQVGTMAIQTGIAIEAIEVALKSLNPVIAIAAGVALVALGTAIKGSLSNAASGGGGAISSGYASSSSGPQTIDARGSAAFQSQPTEIHITGEFKQQGKALVAVIDETQYAKKIKT